MRQLVCSTRANGLAFCWLAVGGCVFEVKNGRTGVSTLNSDSGLTNSDSVYVDDRLIGLTEYATFCNEDATAQLAKLLSESEWQRLRSVEAADLWECTLVYVELAAIILLFADNPFGSVCEVAKAEWPLELVRRRWEVGCLLERSGALVEKLAKFCVQTLRYMSTPFHWALECLTIPDRVQYASRVRYDAATARAAFQKRAKELYVTLTAPEFIRLWVDRHSIIPKKDLVEKAGGIENSLAHFLAKLKGPLRPLSWVAASTNPKGPYRRTGGSFLRCAHIRTTGHILNRERAREILWDLLGGSLAWNKLDAMKEIDFMACSLAYVELAAIVERVIFQAFGSAAPSLLKKFEAVITDKRIVYAWIGGCILQFAQVPISDLIHFCALDLHYQPSTDYWTLECIRQGPEDIRRERASGDPSVRLTELLAGFQEKMSVTEFAELAALKRRDKATRLRQRASAHRLNENTHTQKPDGPRGVQLTSSHQLNVQFSAARLLAFSTKVKTGAGEDKTGAGEDKTGAGDDKTGAGDDKSGAGDDKNGVVLVGVEKVMRKRKEIDQRMRLHILLLFGAAQTKVCAHIPVNPFNQENNLKRSLVLGGVVMRSSIAGGSVETNTLLLGAIVTCEVFGKTVDLVKAVAPVRPWDSISTLMVDGLKLLENIPDLVVGMPGVEHVDLSTEELDGLHAEVTENWKLRSRIMVIQSDCLHAIDQVCQAHPQTCGVPMDLRGKIQQWLDVFRKDAEWDRSMFPGVEATTMKDLKFAMLGLSRLPGTHVPAILLPELMPWSPDAVLRSLWKDAKARLEAGDCDTKDDEGVMNALVVWDTFKAKVREQAERGCGFSQ
ncbi:hypothetical protein GNI_183520 [Gregarina niphandrodes]|uniref:Uncharacterized protein n=1 Tax=Gregarina niphandrodes TaxID=110365 RepID=A0A023AXI4_GRENI|nr:hypothetical protein GNI_183520 [Gregarina niphandrodes]EZG43183.1 hypothetical protein GNI_183520 [Gregarina niphandrodes]|eukprot:XP_011133551.1 hypothetical protein GNI_183520 [Gregarina niphandrodes]